MHKQSILVFLFCVFAISANTQNNRINKSENIGWYNYFGTFKLSQKFDLHTEYQWRRELNLTF